MRFLCLHGKGTNSQTLGAQLSALRYQLGDVEHSFEFVEGTVPEKAAPELQALFSPNEKFFSFFDDQDPQSCLDALNNLEHYVKVEGPFDGVIAFSQGGALASTLLVRQMRQPSTTVAFKVAIFFSGGLAADPYLLERGIITPLDAEDAKGTINIPTVHVWGAADMGESEWPPKLLRLCKEASRESYQHTGGHEIPGSKDRAAVTRVVQLIRRAIWRAENSRDKDVRSPNTIY